MARYYQSITVYSQAAGVALDRTIPITDMDGVDGVELFFYFVSPSGCQTILGTLRVNIPASIQTIQQFGSILNSSGPFFYVFYAGPAKSLQVVLATDTAAGTGSLLVTGRYRGA